MGEAKAYFPEAVKKAGEIEDKFEGKTIIARYGKEIDAIRLFEKKADRTVARFGFLGSLRIRRQNC